MVSPRRPKVSPDARTIGLAAAALVAVGAGLALHARGDVRAANWVWAGSTFVLLVPLTWSVIRSLIRRDVGVDAIALLSMSGALAVGQYLAGAVVAVMLAGGNALEASARRRARRELSALAERAPTTAGVRRGDQVVVVPVDEVRTGDIVVVRTGEVVPADGVVVSRRAVVDTAALTGEPLPVALDAGDEVASGSANAGGVFELRAVRAASESAYAAIVRMVRDAENQQAPFVRMADRYAAGFLPVAVAAAVAAWLISGSPVRAVAVLVVATPCPLILAAPVALICVTRRSGGSDRQGSGRDRSAGWCPHGAARQDRNAHPRDPGGGADRCSKRRR